MSVGTDPRALRVATGVDVHPYVEGRPLIMGGIAIEHDRGLEGHSDADVIAHAVTDAILGAAGMDDIGEYFPSDDASLHGADSMGLLQTVVEDIRQRGLEIVNVDVVAICQAPRLAPYREQIRANLARVLEIEASRVTVRATTTDHLGFLGRGEGAAAIATCLMLHLI